VSPGPASDRRARAAGARAPAVRIRARPASGMPPLPPGPYTAGMPLPITGAAHEAPSGADFVWFVYGSSLDREAFAAWAGEHGYAAPDFSRAVPARLEGWRLSFDVVSRFWGGAVGSLAAATGARVEGLAVPMPGKARGLADHKEGAISGLYQPMEVDVAPLAGGGLIRAAAYVASPGRRLASEQAPSPAWLDAVLRGARSAGLSPEWLAELARLRERR
jgi:gamma-glutamylcyclotransferase